MFLKFTCHEPHTSVTTSQKLQMSVKELNSRLVDTCTHLYLTKKLSTFNIMHITCTYCSMKTVLKKALDLGLASGSVQAYMSMESMKGK